MIKLVFCLRRSSHLSREEFQRYWREEHGPIVREHGGPRRAPQAPRVARIAPAKPWRSSFRRCGDGVAELWWESAEGLAAARATPEGRAAGRRLLEDERRFIDLARSTVTLGEEQAVVER